MARTSVAVDPQLDALTPKAWPARITVLLQDGRELSEYVPNPKGDPENPLGWPEVKEKFGLLVEGLVPAAAAREVVAMRTVLLEPLDIGSGGRQRPRVLRAAWPTLPLEWHHRDEVRVATPDLPPLRATLLVQGHRIAAELLNLTETGLGLGLKQVPPFALQGEMQVDTLLPGGMALHLVGDVRHSGQLDDDPLPVRVGLVLRDLPPEVRESLRRMIQARRIILSESIREE